MGLRNLLLSPFCLSVLSFALAGSAAPNTAEAVQVIRLDDVGAGANVTVTYKGIVENVFAGQYLMHYVGTSTSFRSFCVDFDHFVSIGQTFSVNARVTSDGLNRGGQVAYLYNTYGLTAMSDDSQAAALQIAMWKWLIDGTTNLSTGSFRYAGSLSLQVNSFLTLSQGRSGQCWWLDAAASGDGLYRGQSVLAPNPAPAPASIGLFGVGALCFAAFRGLSRPRPAGGPQIKALFVA